MGGRGMDAQGEARVIEGAGGMGAQGGSQEGWVRRGDRGWLKLERGWYGAVESQRWGIGLGGVIGEWRSGVGVGDIW